MLLSKILRHVKKKGIAYAVTNFVDTEITRISVPSESDGNSILFFNRALPDDFAFNYGACPVKNDIVFEGINLRNLIRVENPRLAIILIAHLFKPYFSQNKQFVSNKAVIHPEARR